jgi:hypothetical protein
MELSRWCKNEASENPMKKFENAAISGHFGEYASNTKSGAPDASSCAKCCRFSASQLS